MMQDTRYRIKKSGYKIQDARFSPQASRRGDRITDKKTILHRVSCILHRKSRASCIMHHDREGITLIEMVLGMVLIGIVALVVANALSTGITGFFVVDYRKEALDQARIAMDRMAKEMRNLKNSASVTTGSTTQFCFTMLDGTNNNMLVNYSYTSSNSSIKRKEAGDVACPSGEGQTLATNIAATFSFAYIQANGTPDTTFSSVTTKRIRIIIPSTVSSETVELQTEVWPRNL